MSIYWEKQGYDQLCAVHCINSLLQGPFFTEIDLAGIAQEIDKQEKMLLSDEPVNFQAQSNNVADDGNFSIQVLSEAIKRIGQMEIDTKINTGQDLTQEQGFICNSQHHWFTIRRVGLTWYNLNSTNKYGPEIISDFYLSAFLQAVQENGYTIFIVRGVYPDNKMLVFIKSNQQNTQLHKNQKYYAVQDVQKTHARRSKKKNYELNIGGSEQGDIDKAIKASLGQQQQLSSDGEFDVDGEIKEEQIKPPQHFTGQGVQMSNAFGKSNYSKFDISREYDPEYYEVILQTIEQNFSMELEEGIELQFQLPNGKYLNWIFRYDATVEDLYDFVYLKTRDAPYKFILSSPFHKIQLLDVYEQIIARDIDSMTLIVISKL